MTTPVRCLAGVLVAIITLVAATPAAAHEGDGTLELLAADVIAPLQVTYRVRLTFKADGHPAADATVTVVAERAGATPTTPQPMTATGEDGVYTATVSFPDSGDWTVRFTAVTPQATLERAETVAPPPSTTTTSSTTTSPPLTTTPLDNGEQGEDGSGSSAPLVVGLVAAALLAGAGIVMARRRRR